MKTRISIAALAVAASVAAAWAQSTTLTPPSLEPTIKVHPAPQVQQQNPPAPAAGSASCICTTQYDPVCARVGQAAWTTYSNACVARCAGATEIMPGPC